MPDIYNKIKKEADMIQERITFNSQNWPIHYQQIGSLSLYNNLDPPNQSLKRTIT